MSLGLNANLNQLGLIRHCITENVRIHIIRFDIRRTGTVEKMNIPNYTLFDWLNITAGWFVIAAVHWIIYKKIKERWMRKDALGGTRVVQVRHPRS